MKSVAGQKLYMDVWRLEEIYKVWERSYHDIITKQQVKDTFSLCGGVIRFVLEDNENAKNIVLDTDI